jgi:hypothetical protein
MMIPDVVQVKALSDYRLQLLFENGEIKIFDMIPYFDYPAFTDLRHNNLFFCVKVLNGTVAWTDEIDMSPDTLYLKSNPVKISIQLLMDQLNQQLGTLSVNLADRIKGLSIFQLGELKEALLDFEEVADLEDWLAQRSLLLSDSDGV